MIFLKSIFVEPEGTPLKALFSILCLVSAALIRFFDGTQPTFTHVPPSVPRSTMATDLPNSAAFIDPAKAAEPLPIKTKSKSYFELSLVSQQSIIIYPYVYLKV